MTKAGAHQALHDAAHDAATAATASVFIIIVGYFRVGASRGAAAASRSPTGTDWGVTAFVRPAADTTDDRAAADADTAADPTTIDYAAGAADTDATIGPATAIVAEAAAAAAAAAVSGTGATATGTDTGSWGPT